MRPSRCLLTIAACLAWAGANVVAQSPALTTWNALQAKRASAGAFHQEFDMDVAYVRPRDTSARKRQHAIDANGPQWRETLGRGVSAHVTLYDGQSRFELEGDEFIRVERKSKDAAPAPAVYKFETFELSKLIEVGRRACGFETGDHMCVLFDVPIKQVMTQSLSTGVVQVRPGMARLIFDTETGVLVARSTSQPVVLPRDSYRYDVVYRLKSLRYSRLSDTALFAVPANIREVKKFTPWDSKRMNSTLSGKPAPELALTTLDGQSVSLESLKGKTVLLDFWATWCPPCRVDAPALDKLHARYSSQLAIVGISVGEAREVVEAFLKKNPHPFPNALSTENDLPRVYGVAAFPTYMIIDADGKFEMAVEGDKGFDGLRSRLRKAGLDVD